MRPTKPAEDLAELEAQMLAAIAEALAGPVAKDVSRKISESAQKNVVGKFSRSSGGISDISNIKSTVSTSGNTVTLEVQDEAPPQPSIFGTPITGSSPTLFSEWIESGDWMDLLKYNTTGEKAKRPARPFMEEAEVEVEADRRAIEAAIKAYLEG